MMARLLIVAAMLCMVAVQSFAIGEYGGSRPDPNWLPDADRNTMFTDVAGKTQVNCDLVGGQSTAVLLTAGQSKSDNVVLFDTYTTVNATSHQMSIANGGCYSSTSGLLGNSVHPVNSAYGASYTTRLADQIITGGSKTRVIVMPFAVGGVSITTFSLLAVDGVTAAVGAYSNRWKVAKSRLDAHGLTCDAVLWDQGETDTIPIASGGSGMADIAANGGRVAYKNNVLSIRSLMDAAGLTCPLYVAQTSYHPSSSGAEQVEIALGQANSVNGTTIKGGPNLDTISHVPANAKRDATSNYVHFTGKNVGLGLADGATDAAALWKTALGL